MIFDISSKKNQVVKDYQSLREKRAHRRKLNSFVIEGFREIQLASSAGYQLSHFLCHFDSLPENQKNFVKESRLDIYNLTLNLLESLCVRKSSSSLLAVSESKPSESLNNFLRDKKNLLVLDHLEKPGNIGGLFRTADGLGAEGVICLGNSGDIYNPNTIRSSLGCVFSVPHFSTDEIDLVLDGFKQFDISPFTLDPEASDLLFDCEFPLKWALVLGREDSGISSQWSDNNTVRSLRIPMLGQIDSLNVGVAGAIAFSVASYLLKKSTPKSAR